MSTATRRSRFTPELMYAKIKAMDPSARVEWSGGVKGHFWINGPEIRDGGILSSGLGHGGTAEDCVRNAFAILTDIQHPKAIQVGGFSGAKMFRWDWGSEQFVYLGCRNDPDYRDDAH